MNIRIKELRKKEGLSQQKFADKLGIARGNIAAYEVGKNAPSDAVISLICTKFNVNEEWLRTGNGEMYQYTDTDDYSEISTLIGEKDKKARQAIIDYWNLSEQDKELFWNFVEKFIKKDTKESVHDTNYIPPTAEEFEKMYPVINSDDEDEKIDVS